MPTLLPDIALTLYLLGFILSIVNLIGDNQKTRPFSEGLILAGFIVHSFSIIYRFVIIGSIPTTSMHDSSSFFAWSVMVIYLYLLYRYKVSFLSAFILPVVLLLMLYCLTLPSEVKPLSPILQSYWLTIHTLFAFVGNAAFAVAGGIGVMYLIQEKNLKRKRPTALFLKLPSVQILDEINYKLITIGFPLFTLAIITGALWAEGAMGSFWRWDPKEVWSFITWLIYASILHLRIVKGYKGKKASILAIVGFLAVLFTYIGVNLFMESYHSFR